MTTARLSTTIEALDQLFGGGIVPGTLTLVSFRPGGGASHIFEQVIRNLAADGLRVLYCVDDAAAQHRPETQAPAVGDALDNIRMWSANHVDDIVRKACATRPSLIVVDCMPMDATRKKWLQGLSDYAEESEVAVIALNLLPKQGRTPQTYREIADVAMELRHDETNHELECMRNAYGRVGGRMRIRFSESSQVEFTIVDSGTPRPKPRTRHQAKRRSYGKRRRGHGTRRPH